MSYDDPYRVRAPSLQHHHYHYQTQARARVTNLFYSEDHYNVFIGSAC